MIKYLEKLQLNSYMRCEHEDNYDTTPCENCEYFYMRTNNMYNIPTCLQQQIRHWALYHIEKGS